MSITKIKLRLTILLTKVVFTNTAIKICIQSKDTSLFSKHVKNIDIHVEELKDITYDLRECIFTKKIDKSVSLECIKSIEIILSLFPINHSKK